MHKGKYRRYITTVILSISCAWVNAACSRSEIPQEEKSDTQVIRIAWEDEAHTLDPRCARNVVSINLMQMLFEGLTRKTSDGNIECAMASSYELSIDKKTYTFFLRDAFWTNGDPVVAKDFEISWKSQLANPSLFPHTSYLTVLEKAQQALNGQDIVDNVGVWSVDDKTLLVTLEHPVANFLELISYVPFFPINHRTAAHVIQEKEHTQLVSNGPFTISAWKHHDTLNLEKNKTYWDINHVSLQGVQLIYADNQTALNLFEKQEIDWTGSPLATLPMDSLEAMHRQGILHATPAAGTMFIRANCAHEQLSNMHLRKALNLAIDRKSICNIAPYAKYQPADTLLPPCFEIHEPKDRADVHLLMQEALIELHIAKEDLHLTLSYASDERNHKIAQIVQQNWKQLCGINITLAPMEDKVLFQNRQQGKYELMLGSWFADVEDPLYFLQVFEKKDNGTNHTFWENRSYQETLSLAASQADEQEKLALLGKAQEILLHEAPIFPIFYFSFNYVQNPHVHNVSVTPYGQILLRDGYITK